MLKILYTTFFTNFKGAIAIVITENETGERKARISNIPLYSNNDEKIDAKNTADWGSTLPIETLKEIIKIVERS